MSRLGKRIIPTPSGVTVTYDDMVLRVKGAKGELSQKFDSFVLCNVTSEGIQISVNNVADLHQKAMWGTLHALIHNMVKGVTEGFERRMEMKGVGYEWTVQGNTVRIKAGFSHPIEIVLPEGITAAVEERMLVIRGIDRQCVGEMAARIRRIRPPEPYKGKGIKYIDEVIRRKSGKQAASSGGSGA